MKRLILISLLLVSGCSKLAKDVEQKQELSSRVVTRTSTLGKQSYMNFFGQTFTIPPYTELLAEFNSDTTTKSKTTITGDKKTDILLLGGAILVGIGCVALFFGVPFKISMGAVILGFVLVACGVAIEQYPILFPVTLVCILIGAGYWMYSEKRAKDTGLALQAVCSTVDNMKVAEPALVQQYITDPLAKSHESKTIEKVTRNARAAKR